MNRNYNTGSSSAAIFFVGNEVEHTPAMGKRTLFVNGLHSPDKILTLAKEKFCDHIYFGANQSFDGSNLLAWDAAIKSCLAENFWCTLDFDVQYMNDIHESGLCEYNKFIPQVSVKIPYIKLLNYNATIKIDDTNFDSTNPGVWCHRVHDLMDSTKFTNWEEYGNDVIIESAQETAVINTKYSIAISSHNKNGEWVYQGSSEEYPGLVVEGNDINFVYDELHKEIAILRSRE